MVTPNPAPSTRTSASRPSSSDATLKGRTFFDSWNSSSTGHQHAESSLTGSTWWRTSRNLKLSEQFKAVPTGGQKRVADTVGAGSPNVGKDSRKVDGVWEEGAKGLRTGDQPSLLKAWGNSQANKTLPQEKVSATKVRKPNSALHDNTPDSASKLLDKRIFDGLCFYVNGSTAPLVSDHRMKHLLAAHGAKHSIALGRRSVTHVVLGTANVHGGAGGGLSASKIQKEIARTGGKTVKFVTAEWVLESIKANRRLPETRYLPLKLAPQSQNTVFPLFRTGATAKEEQG